MSAIVRDTPVRAGELRAGVSDALGAIVNRCLEKNRDARYASAAELYDDLAGCRSDLASRRPAILALAGKPWFAIPGAAFVAILLATVSWQAWRSSRVHWARTVALPEVKRLIDEQRSCAAFRLVEKVESYLRTTRRSRGSGRTSCVGSPFTRIRQGPISTSETIWIQQPTLRGTMWAARRS
jgi:hypothetical protein